jgi:hypothetical protein
MEASKLANTVEVDAPAVATGNTGTANRASANAP